MSDEEYVRSRWRDVREEVQHSLKISPTEWQGYVLANDEGRDELLSSGNRAERWAKARDYTERRLREIAELDQEMNLLRGMVILLSVERGDKTAPIYQRTISRLQLSRAELTKGMSTQ